MVSSYITGIYIILLHEVEMFFHATLLILLWLVDIKRLKITTHLYLLRPSMFPITWEVFAFFTLLLYNHKFKVVSMLRKMLAIYIDEYY
jgi:hypothetical protein